MTNGPSRWWDSESYADVPAPESSWSFSAIGGDPTGTAAATSFRAVDKPTPAYLRLTGHRRAGNRRRPFRGDAHSSSARTHVQQCRRPAGVTDAHRPAKRSPARCGRARIPSANSSASAGVSGSRGRLVNLAGVADDAESIASQRCVRLAARGAEGGQARGGERHQ